MTRDRITEERSLVREHIKKVLLFLAVIAVLVFVAYAPILFGQNSHPADQVYLPIGGHAVAGATTYATEMRLTNHSSDHVSVSITFTPANSSDTDPHFPLSRYFPDAIRLAPNETGYELSDERLQKIGINGIGALIFDGCLVGADCSLQFDAIRDKRVERVPNARARRAISVETRIYSYATATGPIGTRGESYPGLPWYDVASSAAPTASGRNRLFITGIRSDARWKTNVVLMNASAYSTTELVAVLHDGTGRERASFGKSLGPSEPWQIAAEIMFPVLVESRMNRQLPVVNPWITVEQVAVVPTEAAKAQRDVVLGCADGCPGFWAQASMIDTLSSDAMLLEGQYETPDRTLQAAAEPTVRVASLRTAALAAPPAARIADVLHATFKGSKCSIEPRVAGGYLVRTLDGRPWVDIAVEEYVKVREMCGAATSGSAR